MRFEGTDDLEGLREDANVAIVAAQEDIVRAGADAAQVVLWATSVSCDADGFEDRTRTSKTAEPSAPSGGFTCVTSKKLKVIHCSTQCQKFVRFRQCLD